MIFVFFVCLNNTCIDIFSHYHQVSCCLYKSSSYRVPASVRFRPTTAEAVPTCPTESTSQKASITRQRCRLTDALDVRPPGCIRCPGSSRGPWSSSERRRRRQRLLGGPAAVFAWTQWFHLCTRRRSLQAEGSPITAVKIHRTLFISCFVLPARNDFLITRLALRKKQKKKKKTCTCLTPAAVCTCVNLSYDCESQFKVPLWRSEMQVHCYRDDQNARSWVTFKPLAPPTSFYSC